MRIRALLIAVGLALLGSVNTSGRGGVPQAPSAHLIGVRVVNGSGELFDRRSGKRFVIRGANYLRLNLAAGSDLLFDPHGVRLERVKRISPRCARSASTPSASSSISPVRSRSGRRPV